MRTASLRRYAHLFLPLGWLAAAWVGCTEPTEQSSTTTSSTISSSSGTGGTGGSEVGAGGSEGGAGGVTIDGGPETGDDGGICIATSAEARRIPVDMIFLMDRSGSMAGPKWDGTKAALTAFFEDPASAGISAGMVYFPAQQSDVCNFASYSALDVSIAPLPENAAALTNSIPFAPLGTSTPTWSALKGTLFAATTYQDAHPLHKVVVVLATDGDATSCPPLEIEAISELAKSARNYNGVRTYVIGVAGSTIANLDQIAAAGGTGKAYDVTNDIHEFAAKIAEIRTDALTCDFELPELPEGKVIQPDLVYFAYAPNGEGDPKIVPRVQKLADCGNLPGWRFDSNTAPTKIVLCPALCTTLQNDPAAKVTVLYGCDPVFP